MTHDAKHIDPCPLCGCRHRSYVFAKNHIRVVHCADCGLLEDIDFIARPQAGTYCPPSAALLQEVFGQSTGMVTLVTSRGGSKSLQPVVEQLCGADRLRVVDFETLDAYPGGSGSIIVDDHLLDQRDLPGTLRLLRERLREGQPVVFLVELVGGRHRRFRKSLLMRDRPARFWPDWSALYKLLLASGFEHIWLHNPKAVQHGSRHAFVSAGAGTRRERPLVSVIMPVFNEAGTFKEAIERVLAKEVDGVDIRVVIVESNSTDGTRQLVAQYDGHEKIHIIWQEKPSGKGHAVREGIAAARGDIILIQDADLEYDVNDYDALVEELTSWRAAFVLGSRHTGDWKMRRFNDMPVIATLCNCAHIFFVWLMNFLVGAGMKDPFTMYKVFYRDCVYGLNFRCDRFDYDRELVIKLCRKGLYPVEIPVNYRARSFAEGKKISILRDGLPWVVQDIQSAVEPLGNPGPLRFS